MIALKKLPANFFFFFLRVIVIVPDFIIPVHLLPQFRFQPFHFFFELFVLLTLYQFVLTQKLIELQQRIIHTVKYLVVNVPALNMNLCIIHLKLSVITPISSYRK